MSSTDVKHSDYLRRMYDAKMSKVDPRLSFHARMRAAMDLMDQEFGPEWRKVVDKADPESPVENTPLDSPATDELFSKLHASAEEEGLPTPPESMRKYGENVNTYSAPKKEEVAPVNSNQQPLVIIIQNRIKSNGNSERKSKPTSSR